MNKTAIKPQNTAISIETKRPPVVSIMGHIDHGKSTLLDYIRKTKIVDTEAGGITQKMSAYKISIKQSENVDGISERSITFLDTPGHEAFKELRNRGTQVADIAILIVAADEGVKPQTVEAIQSIKSAGLSMIVAINKIDKPGASAEKVKNGLLEHEVYVEGYGGDTPIVEISAVTGKGIPELLDMIILVTDILELKDNPNKNAEGIIIEAKIDKLKGISATLVIKEGTIRSGQFVVCENTLAPTRILEDFQGQKIESAGASDPIRIIGFSEIPPVGSIFQTVESKKDAEKIVLQNKLSRNKPKENLQIGGESENSIVIPVVIKASTTDVLEAIHHEIKKIKSDRVGVRIISSGVGFISEADVKSALTNSRGIVLGFEVKTDASAKALAERDGVLIETFNIIYKLTEWLENFIKEKTPRMTVEESTGKAKILKFFSKTKDRQVIGGRIEEGFIKVGSEVKVLRRDTEIARGKIKELQQSRSKTDEIKEGEFGALIECKMELAPGDKIESFITVEK